jgi:hypothetical protein
MRKFGERAGAKKRGGIFRPADAGDLHVPPFPNRAAQVKIAAAISSGKPIFLRDGMDSGTSAKCKFLLTLSGGDGLLSHSAFL